MDRFRSSTYSSKNNWSILSETYLIQCQFSIKKSFTSAYFTSWASMKALDPQIFPETCVIKVMIQLKASGTQNKFKGLLFQTTVETSW